MAEDRDGGSWRGDGDPLQCVAGRTVAHAVGQYMDTSRAGPAGDVLQEGGQMIISFFDRVCVGGVGNRPHGARTGRPTVKNGRSVELEIDRELRRSEGGAFEAHIEPVDEDQCFLGRRTSDNAAKALKEEVLGHRGHRMGHDVPFRIFLEIKTPPGRTRKRAETAIFRQGDATFTIVNLIVPLAAVALDFGIVGVKIVRFTVRCVEDLEADDRSQVGFLRRLRRGRAGRGGSSGAPGAAGRGPVRGLSPGRGSKLEPQCASAT
ncbi:hypothetical protein D3C72_742050 [compost metagenome]